MSATVHTGDLVLSTGDSTIARMMFEATGGLYDQLNKSTTKIAARATGAVSSATGAVGSVRGFTTVNTGINGNKVSDIAGHVAARITNYNPNVVIIEVGVNDVPASTADFNTQYDSMLSQVRSTLPSAQIVCLSILCYGEIWAAGPVWNNGPTDTNFLEPFNADIQALCVTYSATYIDVRAALLAIEPTINPTKANNAFTSDGVHEVIQSSQITLGSWARPSFTVIP
jgi:lysophospholipase L1-like esterase